MRIGIDAMGGDHAPVEEVKGALAARELLAPEDRIVLIGQEPAILAQLQATDGWRDFIEIHHAPQVVGMGETPVETLRNKPDSSVAVMAQLHRDGKIGACISAGNTGAFVAATTMHLRRLAGVHRPGIAVVTSTPQGPVAICDVGANVNCRPQHLHQYAIMASLYVQVICGVKQPRVALLSVGQEEEKGNDLVKGARDLLRADSNIRFVGNVEGRDLFRGVCDVVVCDGFVGNVVLKVIEGLARSVVKGMVEELQAALQGQTDAIRKAAKKMFLKYDFNEYGGAPLLGVGGICIICHGASDSKGIKNAVRVAKDFSHRRVNEQITEFITQGQRIVHG